MEFAPKRPVPVFPLPSVVLFPRVALPLHIFELRYRTMVRDVLSGERMIAMVLLRPGWEKDYFGKPEHYPMGCLGRIEQVQWLENDCYDLKLRGLSRVRLGLPAREFPYRTAHVQVVPQAPFGEEDPLVQSEHVALREAHRQLAERLAGAAGTAPLEEALGYEGVVNWMSMYLPVSAPEKQALLELDSVIERGRRVRDLLEAELRRPERPEGGPEAGN